MGDLERSEERLAGWLRLYRPGLEYTVFKFPSVGLMRDAEDCLADRSKLKAALFKEEPGEEYLWRGLYDRETRTIFVPVRGRRFDERAVSHEFGHALTLDDSQFGFKEDWKSKVRGELEADLWSYKITGSPRKVRWVWEKTMPNLQTCYGVSRKDLVIFIRDQLELLDAPETWKTEFRRKPGGRY